VFQFEISRPEAAIRCFAGRRHDREAWDHLECVLAPMHIKSAQLRPMLAAKPWRRSM
jgi:hypothetical protein